MIHQWKPLFKIAAYSLYTIIFFVIIQIIVYVVSPPPADVIGFFNLFHKNTFLGLLSLDLIMLLDWILEIPLIITLYILLKRTNRSLALLAAVLAFVGISIYFSSGICFEMLLLSRQYFTAVTEIEKTALLTAGKMLLAVYQGTAFNVSYVVVAFALLLDTLLMLKSKFFSKKIAYIGIIMGVLMLLPPTAGNIGFVCSFLSLIPMIIWYILVANKLLHLK